MSAGHCVSLPLRQWIRWKPGSSTPSAAPDRASCCAPVLSANAQASRRFPEAEPGPALGLGTEAAAPEIALLGGYLQVLASENASRSPTSAPASQLYILAGPLRLRQPCLRVRLVPLAFSRAIAVRGFRALRAQRTSGREAVPVIVQLECAGLGLQVCQPDKERQPAAAPGCRRAFT